MLEMLEMLEIDRIYIDRSLTNHNRINIVKGSNLKEP